MSETEKSTCLIGDTHFGKRFKTGVPLNRRGEIEQEFYNRFKELLGSNTELIVQLGDLFDSTIVDLETIMHVYEIIGKAALAKPNTTFVFIRGNHDSSRNETVNWTAFDTLIKMCARFHNIVFVKDVKRIGNKVFIGWDYFRDKPLSKVFEEVNLNETDEIFGHFEEPIDEAFWGIHNIVYSGHIHKKHFNEPIIYVGSILPIAFGEESDTAIMETVTLQELLDKKPEEIKHKRVRVILKEGETLPTDIDCLQLISKQEEVNEIDGEVLLDTDIQEMDMKKLFEEELCLSGLAEQLFDKYIKKLNATR